MEIIDEIEPTRRGPYAGAVGYVDFGGNMDTCIALRTMVIAGGKVYIQAGGGIVADSVPAAEYEETMNKAKAMLRAISIAEAGFGGVRGIRDQGSGISRPISDFSSAFPNKSARRLSDNRGIAGDCLHRYNGCSLSFLLHRGSGAGHGRPARTTCRTSG